MREIWNICRFEIQLLFGQPRNYFIMFAAPLLFTLLFGNLMMGGDQKFHILLVDEDKSVLSQSFYNRLSEENLPFTLEKSSKGSALEKLKDKDVTGVVMISKGFSDSIIAGENPEISFRHVPDFTSSQTVTSVMESKLSTLYLEVTASKVWSKYSQKGWANMYETLQKTRDSDVAIKQQVVVGDKTSTENGMSRSATGFSIMFVMMTLIGVTGTLIEIKQNGLWSRLLMTPASRVQIIAGYLLAFFFIGWIQFGVLMVATHVIFGAEWGNPLLLMVLVSVMLLVIVCLGIAITSVSKTTEQQTVFANLIVVSTCMLAGVYWPLEVMPKYMQAIAEFLPQTWAMRGFDNIVMGSSIWESVGVLLLFAFVFSFVGVWKTRVHS